MNIFPIALDIQCMISCHLRVMRESKKEQRFSRKSFPTNISLTDVIRTLPDNSTAAKWFADIRSSDRPRLRHIGGWRQELVSSVTDCYTLG